MAFTLVGLAVARSSSSFQEMGFGPSRKLIRPYAAISGRFLGIWGFGIGHVLAVNVVNGARIMSKYTDRIEPLSPKQTCILQLCAAQVPTKQIAVQLRSHPAAIKRHKERILRKLNVHTTSAAVDVITRIRVERHSGAETAPSRSRL
jgi:DNA-binding CsgD family transcriptional regulator